MRYSPLKQTTPIGCPCQRLPDLRGNTVTVKCLYATAIARKSLWAAQEWLYHLRKPLQNTHYFQSAFPINRVYENYFSATTGTADILHFEPRPESLYWLVCLCPAHLQSKGKFDIKEHSEGYYFITKKTSTYKWRQRCRVCVTARHSLCSYSELS